jgi:hypothetical protein
VTLLLASALLSAAVGLAVILPILTRRSAMLHDATAGSVQDADAQKRVVLNELRELEYDFLGGKLDETDYQELKERLAREAVVAMRAVDAAHGTGAGGSPVADASADPDQSASAASDPHGCGFVNRTGSRFCAGCGAQLR